MWKVKGTCVIQRWRTLQSSHGRPNVQRLNPKGTGFTGGQGHFSHTEGRGHCCRCSRFKETDPIVSGLQKATKYWVRGGRSSRWVRSRKWRELIVSSGWNGTLCRWARWRKFKVILLSLGLRTQPVGNVLGLQAERFKKITSVLHAPAMKFKPVITNIQALHFQ